MHITHILCINKYKYLYKKNILLGILIQQILFILIIKLCVVHSYITKPN